MKRIVAMTLTAVMFGSLLFGHYAYAHTFVENPDASTIAKIQVFKVESKLIASNISNGTVSQWHVSKSREYWGSNETSALSQKDSTLANRLSASINDMYLMAGQQNASSTIANQKADAINQLLDQAESEEVGSSSQGNATVQALALVGVLNEVLEDYGTAIGSKVDLTNMNNMNMSSSGNNMQGMSEMSSNNSMSGMSGTPIVNTAAYQSAQALAGAAKTMFGSLQSIAPSTASPYLVKAGAALNALGQKINDRSSGNDIMTVVHMQIHPNLISAFNIETVPEFPMPVLLAMMSFIGVIVVPRIFHGK
ncbi:MAG: hypothetical protein KGH88_01405 [Thaumarchaeota archaeon]|nr:hypothetical protein [Nitrososphaerota archaeon]